MSRLTAVAAFLLLAITFAAVASPAEAADGPLPQELYPDADVIISESARGDVLITEKVVTDEGAKYETRTVRAGSNLTVADWSDVDGDIDIVMDGGRLGTLTLVNVDKKPKVESPVDISFSMVSGEVSTLVAVGVQTSIAMSLNDSYFTAYCPVGVLRMDITGSVRELRTTEDLIEIEELDLTVSDGAVIDRLYPTGEDGRYVTVNVAMNGGHVGYMSNQRAVVTFMDYELRSGTINYLCLGADTEGGSGYYLNNLWTFYVQREADIHISSQMDIGTAILGGGIVQIPSILCTDELPALPVPSARNILIDAHDQYISAYTCFKTGTRDDAYRFGNYEIGGNPGKSAIRTTYYVSYQSGQVYGDGGVWSSWAGCHVDGANFIYLDTSLAVPSGSTLTVASGGGIVNGGFVVLSGEMTVEGYFENNGVIERRGGATVEGDITGKGVVATSIDAHPSEGTAEVMTVMDDAVVLTSSRGDSLTHAVVRFFDRSPGGIQCEVSITTLNGTDLAGSKLVVALQRVEYERDHSVWTFSLSGFQLGSDDMDVVISIPGWLQDGYAAKVTDSSGNLMEVVSYESGVVSFRAPANGTYSFEAVPEGELDDPGLLGDPLFINSIIATAIVIVAAVAVYFLLRRD